MRASFEIFMSVLSSKIERWFENSFPFVAVGLAVVLLVVGIPYVSARSRNRRLDAWARSVTATLTESQRNAMWEIWQSFKSGRVPDIDPLLWLSNDDKEYINAVCSAEVRPSEFGPANSLRLAQFSSLLERGYKPEHAAIIVGMTINRVGRKDV